MNASVTSTDIVRQANPVSPLSRDEGKDVSLIRRCLRDAIEESRWKYDALAMEMGLTNAAYLSQMLSGEKAIGTKHLRALPDEVEATFARLYAESFGMIVVRPSCGEDAMRHLVAGLFGIFETLRGTTALPMKAGPPIKASLPQQTQRKAG